MSNDWRQFHVPPAASPAVVDPRRRLRLVQAGAATLLAILFARAVQLELTQGAAFRDAAAQPVRQTTILPGPRGRILAADGTVLACDREVAAVAVQYRWLQDPPDARWLRQTARARLSQSARKDCVRVAAAESSLRRERSEMARRLAALCGATLEEWTRRERAVQERVERIAARVAMASPLVGDDPNPANANTDKAGATRTRRSEDIAEERASHILADDVPAAAVAEIEAHPERYPAAKIVRHLRRFYPCGELAAHVLGYVGPGEDDRDGEPAGRDGVERQYDQRLRGRNGVRVQLSDHAGHALTTYCETEPRGGGDLRLTILPKLQQTAEKLLDDALSRKAMQPGEDEPGGGAVAVIDLRDVHCWRPPPPRASTQTFSSTLRARDATQTFSFPVTTPRALKPCFTPRTVPCSIASCRWLCRPARPSRCSPQSPCWSRPASIRRRRFTAKAICTSRRRCVVRSSSIRASATAT